MNFRFKDIKVQTSKLCPDESYRFRRAIYRWWFLFATLFPPRVYEYESEDEDEDMDTYDGRLAFLDSFQTSDLTEILQIHCFLYEMLRWTLVASKQHESCRSKQNSLST